MTYHSKSNPNRKPGRPAGVFIHADVMDELRAGRHTVRQTFLRGHVDRFINPWKPQTYKDAGKGRDPVESVIFFTDQLRQMLGTKRSETVDDLIVNLAKKKPRLLRARKLAPGKWELQTKKREPTKDHGLTIPAPVRKLFEAGDVTPMETLHLARIASFTMRGDPCYLTNGSFGTLFGIGKERVKDIIAGLVRKKIIKTEKLTCKELCQRLEDGGHDNGVKGKRGRFRRLITPTMEELIKLEPDIGEEDDEYDY